MQGPPMRPSKNLGNRTPLETYWKVQLVSVKVQAHNSLEPPLEYRPDAFDDSSFIITFLIIVGVTEILCSFKLILEGKTGKEFWSSQD